MKRFIFPVLLLFPVFILMSGCQKEEDEILIKPAARLYPEISMQNYDEAALIIDDYLKSQHDSSSEKNLSDLKDWLLSSECIRQVHLYKGLYDSFPPQLSMHMEFTPGQPSKGAHLYLYLNEDGHLSVASLLPKK